MRGPLVVVALLYSAGIIVGQLLSLHIGWLFGLSFAFAAFAMFTPRLRMPALCLLLPLAGWTNLATRTAVLSPLDLRLLLSANPEYLDVRGAMVEAPVLRVHERGERVIQRCVVDLQVQALRRSGREWEPAFGCVTASTPGMLGADYFAGRTVEARGVIQTPSGPAAPGLFDYRTYLRYRGVYHQLRCETTNDWRLAITPGTPLSAPPLSDRFCQWGQGVLAKGLGPQDPSLRLLWAMVLGWKTALTQEVAEPFMQSGTLHIFAISGLHIALIATIIVSVLRVLRLPRGASGLVVIPLIWFYTGATGWQASAIRSTVMMTVIIAGWALRRPSNLVNSLAAAGFIILVWDPTQLFQASFQLSFFVVLGMALLLPPIEALRAKLLRPDPLLPPELRPRWRLWLDKPVGAVTTSLATSVAAWLGSMPLIAYYFYMVTPVSLAANLLIVPLSSLALMSSLGSLTCGDWLPQCTVLFNHSSWLFMLWMIDLSEWFAILPGAYFYVKQPCAIEFGVYYTLLSGVLTGTFIRPVLRRWAWLSGFILLAGLAWHWRADHDDFLLTVLPTPAGVTFVDAPGQSDDLLIDCGDATAAKALVKPFVRSQGVNRLKSVLLTHPDVRHSGGVDLIWKHFGVERIVTSALGGRSPAYRDLARKLEQSEGVWKRVQRNSALGAWTVLHPDATDKISRGEDGAVVLRSRLHGTVVLVLSDLGRLGQQTILQRENDLHADILIAALPSGEGGLSESLLDAVRPSLLIVACADYPATARPKSALRERLNRRHLPTIYTSDTGAALLRIRPSGWQLWTMDGARSYFGRSDKPSR